MSKRLKANSVFDADGKPTSISLKPIFTSAWNNSSFCDTFIGTASAWLPSRKSTLHQRGAAVRTRLGHWRSGKWMGGNARYFLDGSFCMAKKYWELNHGWTRMDTDKIPGRAGLAVPASVARADARSAIRTERLGLP